MSFDEVRLRRNGSSVIQAMLKRLAEEAVREEARQEARQEERQEEDQELPLGLNTVRTVPVETAKPLTKAALY
jgi:Arc/MetJ-type ribon-helix-helix transcriptional regulator